MLSDALTETKQKLTNAQKEEIKHDKTITKEDVKENEGSENLQEVSYLHIGAIRGA